VRHAFALCTRSSIRSRAVDDLADTARHVRRRWYVYAPILLIWVFAFIRLFVDHTPRIPLLINWTPSLPYTVAWLSPVKDAVKRGDYVLYRFAGDAAKHYKGLAQQPFFKIVRGLPGDRVTVTDRVVYVNGHAVGVAKPRTFDGRLLEPIAAGTIPDGYYFAQGTAADSFDSRYAASGLVRRDQLLGQVTPIF